MSVVTITVPNPIVPVSPATSFHVVIKDDSGSVVYDAEHGNEAFEVDLDPGCYTCYVTYNGHTNGWCFCVSNCVCPVVTDSTITEPSPGLFHLNITFDISDVSPTSSCPFEIAFNDGVRRAPIYITNDTQFTSLSGSTATKTLVIFSDHCSVDVFNAQGCNCYHADLSFDCSAPPFPTAMPEVVSSGGSWYIKLKFPSYGTGCHTFTLNYSQVNVHPGYAADHGTVTITLSAVGLYPFNLLAHVTPAPTASVDGIMSYVIQLTDCCGTVSTLTGPYNSLPSA